MILRYLLEKEFKQTVRNKFLSKLLVVLPVMIIVVFPYVTSQEVADVKVCVVDSDRSPASARLVGKVAATPVFRLVGVVSSGGQAMERVESGEADVALEIPRGFQRSVGTGLPGQVMVAANAVNGIRGGLGAQYLAAVVADCEADLRGESGAAPPVRAAVATSYRFNPTLDYKVYMVPGLISVLLMLLCCALTALNVAGEKEAGTIEQVNVTPVPKWAFILSKLIPNWVIGLLALAFGMSFAWLVHGIVPAGGVAPVAVSAALYILVASAMGMVISNYSATMQQAMFVMFFFMILMMLTCGLFTPIESMPGWVQALTEANPMRPFVHAMRQAYLKGSSVAELAPDLCAMGAFAAALGVWAVASYRKGG